jgi:YidC/Oxa1 family membrane protein insertase
MQEALMKFYSENSFNPMAGCLPMLVQLPIFIGLYGALSSPQFLAETVHEKFLFLRGLSYTLQSHAGEAMDGTFNVKKDDSFSIDKTVKLTMNTGAVQEHEVKDAQHAVRAFPRPLMPGQPVTLTLDFSKLGLSDDYKTLVKAADVLVVNNKSHELEQVQFVNQNGRLKQQINTAPAQDHINMDVLLLILLYGVLTLLYQKVVTPKASPSAKDDPTAAAMQSPMMKLMPLMFVVMMFFIPIPAGALIYLVVTTAMMFIQTLWVNFSEDRKAKANPAKPSSQVVDIKADHVTTPR